MQSIAILSVSLRNAEIAARKGDVSRVVKYIREAARAADHLRETSLVNYLTRIHKTISEGDTDAMTIEEVRRSISVGRDLWMQLLRENDTVWKPKGDTHG